MVVVARSPSAVCLSRLLLLFCIAAAGAGVAGEPRQRHERRLAADHQPPPQPTSSPPPPPPPPDNEDPLTVLLRAVQRQQQLQRQLEQGQPPQVNVSQLLINRFYHLFRDTELGRVWTNGTPAAATTLGGGNQEEPATLETRRMASAGAGGQPAEEEPAARGRHYFRVLNRVFARVELPEAYRARARHSTAGAHCGQHIGCVDEIPNFPSLLKKSNVSASFTIYTRDSPKGLKVPYEPTMHHQLRDPTADQIELHERLRSAASAAAAVSAAAAAVTAAAAGPSLTTSLAAAAAAQGNQQPPSPLAGPMRLVSLAAAGSHLARQHHHRLPLAAAAAAAAASQASHHRRHQVATAASWQAAVALVRSQEFPFDLAALEASGFNGSLNTRIIVGGYFAKEDEEWIDEVVRQWQLLEPHSNIIKVSWADSNRGLYHTAAYNSRIVARQLTLLLFYLDQLFRLDPGKLHLVGHSLGAHIAGFVGADNEGRVARITGLDPAGPIFVELNASMRLDPGDARFVDVLHTNGGPITKGALGLHTPSGHVDYYCNGGSLQPGCYFSSVTRSIMDPVERVACSHRRSYRYFLEITKLAIPTSGGGGGERVERRLDAHSTRLPRAFLFEARHEELARLAQPEIVLMSNQLARRESSAPAASASATPTAELAPLRRRLEFHLLQPDFPQGKRGLYYFKTRSEAPFFATKQFALVIRTEQLVRRKMALMAKIDQTLVLEAEVDEIPGVYTLPFAPNDPRILDSLGGGGEEGGRVPQLSLMWKQRSFNLLLSQQNELRISGLELSLLDSDSDEPALIRYSMAPSTTSTTTTASSSSSSGAATPTTTTSTSAPGPSQEMALARNQWHRFEGRLERPASSRR